MGDRLVSVQPALEAQPANAQDHRHSMNYELTQEFFFDSAHTLDREVEAVPSKRVHGHTYHAEVTVSGVPDPTTGMLMDLGILRRAIGDLRDRLDHRMLNEIDGLGAPTLENLCRFVLAEMRSSVPLVCAVTIARRASGDRCTLIASS